MLLQKMVVFFNVKNVKYDIIIDPENWTAEQRFCLDIEGSLRMAGGHAICKLLDVESFNKYDLY